MTEPRPADCKATLADDIMVCERCGLEWLAAVEGLACAPITLERLRKRADSNVTRSQTSLAIVDDLRRAGKPAGSREARLALSENAAILRLIERVMADGIIKDRLTGKKT